MRQPKRPKPRSRLPSLSRPRLQFIADTLAQSGQPRFVQDAVMQSLLAATNPSAESPLVVIQTLEMEERLNIQQASQGYAQTLNAVGQRGRAALSMMSDQEWQKLLDDDD